MQFAESSESREEADGAEMDRNLQGEVAHPPAPPPAPVADALIPPGGVAPAREIRPVAQAIVTVDQDAWQYIPFSDDDEDDFMESEDREQFDDAASFSSSSSSSAASLSESASEPQNSGAGAGRPTVRDDFTNDNDVADSPSPASSLRGSGSSHTDDDIERDRRIRKRAERLQRHKRDMARINANRRTKEARGLLNQMIPHHDYNHKCDICVYGGGEDFDEHLRNDMDAIMALEHRNFESSNRPDLFRMILRKRRDTIEKHLARRGIPYKPWTMKMLKEHFSARSRHTLNARRDLAEEIWRMQQAEDELWQNGIREENRVTNERRIDVRNLKEYRECVKLKMDLWKRYGEAKAEENYHANGNASAGGGAGGNSSYFAQKLGGSRGKEHWSMTKLASLNTISHYVLSQAEDV